MNWEAIGAVGETVGAMAVVVTLFFLVVQLRQSTRAIEESNKLERAAALDRHADSISRWRGMLADNGELAELWDRAHSDAELGQTEVLRVGNAWISFLNIQRSNYERALVAREPGLASQAARGVAAEAFESEIFTRLWHNTREWHRLASPEFVTAVDRAREELDGGGANFTPFWHLLDPVAEKPEQT